MHQLLNNFTYVTQNISKQDYWNLCLIISNLTLNSRSVNLNFPDHFNSATASFTRRNFLNSVKKEMKKMYKMFTAYCATSRGKYGFQI